MEKAQNALPTNTPAEKTFAIADRVSQVAPASTCHHIETVTAWKCNKHCPDYAQMDRAKFKYCDEV